MTGWPVEVELAEVVARFVALYRRRTRRSVTEHGLLVDAERALARYQGERARRHHARAADPDGHRFTY